MKQILVLAALLIGLISSLPCRAGYINYLGSNVGPIADGIAISVESYGPARDVYFDVTSSPGTVANVDLYFTATHTWIGDLRVTLIAPNGKRHLIFARTGATSADSPGYGSRLAGEYEFFSSGSDWWTAAQSNSPIPPNLYQTVVSGGAGVSAPAPGTSMIAAFAGIPANGRWILRFEDGFKGDTGEVSAARLALDTIGTDLLVSSADDTGSGSLRAAMTAAIDGDHIVFDPTFFASSRTINLEAPLPDINATMSIEGPGANRLTVQRAYDAATDFRIFTIGNSAAGVSLSGMTLSNGRSSNYGGGIKSNSPLTLSGMNIVGNRVQGFGGGVSLRGVGGSFIDSSFSGNVSSFGGAISIVGNAINVNPLRIRNCTISGNHADSVGAIYNLSGDPGSTSVVEIVNSTITDNTGDSFEGIVSWSQNGAASSQILLRNSIVVGNLPGNLRTQTFADSGPATITSQGFNLSDNYNGAMTLLPSDVLGDPKLGPLALNGGSTPTRLLLGGSAAIDAGNTSGSARDQRGAARLICQPPLGNGRDCGDIGAVEMQYFMVTNTDDAGPGSLRDAITMANDNGEDLDDILFDPGVFQTPQTITLQSVLPTINSALTISGTGADRLEITRDDSAAEFRIFYAEAGAGGALSGMTISNGSAYSGGGILSLTPLSITAMRFTGNLASGGLAGGGAYLAGSSSIVTDSTFDHNISVGGGAGIAFESTEGKDMRIINSTFSDNDGGGVGYINFDGTSTLVLISNTIANNTGQPGIFIFNQPPGVSVRAVLRNTIVAYNLPTNFSGSSSSEFVSLGHNLTNDDDGLVLDQPSDLFDADPALAPLAFNGGPTPTRALLTGSGALDNGNNEGSGKLSDQRGFGFARTVDLAHVNNGDGTDIGAYEAQFDPSDVLFANGFD
ncbi:MAG TPA: choice-of-anchor Q domain-containing protein [Dokdonella sp.]|uniref:choice-of-anchor Q domain-containing protein n=1 Tax=Dokdonella sp. TaxID=2291710 RepID=UPI002D7F3024|nr:choice-of-anchor Q domain-containing protein [Dokdonella sp.]HET9032608.1 choice-of-anchor Q domain-containing protein [Dokdonella sp.]